MPAPDRIRTALVDDEMPARALLREYLSAYDDVEIIAECANGFEAVKQLGELQPDLVFLDIQMPKLNGFEVLELLAPVPAVVFCTAYDEYALKAFEVHAVDYLLKPFPRERLAESLTKVRALLAERPGKGAGAAGADVEDSGPPRRRTSPDDVAKAAAQARALAATARGDGTYLERVVVRNGSAVDVVPVEAIEVIGAQDDYVAVHAAGKVHLKAQPLGELAETLDPNRFVRIHRSYVVPIDRIVRIEPYTKDSRVAVLKNGLQVPVSKSGYARLQELM